MKTIEIIIMIVQSLVGAATWFYVFAATFNYPATIEYYAIPLIAAAAGSAVLSAFWSCVTSVPAYRVALYYSLPFFGWTIFQSTSGGDFMSTIFWLSITAGVYICGLAGSYSVRVMNLRKPGAMWVTPSTPA